MLLTAGLSLAMYTHGQTLDTLAVPGAGANIADINVKGGRLFATAGSKVFYATNPTSWTAAAPVPEFLPY